MPLAEVKNRLSEVVDRLEREHGHVIITKHGRPAAVVISVEDLHSLEETRATVSHSARLERTERKRLFQYITADIAVFPARTVS
jgi:antitoxin YefM